MSDLAEFRTAVLQLLDDPASARYTTDLVERALRQSLREYSRRRPLLATLNVDGTGDSLLELPADFQPMQVLMVELHEETALPQSELRFYAYHQDGQWCLHLMDAAPAATQSLDVTYTTTHSIDGLDGAAGTTLPLEDESAVQLGAAGYAALYRAVSRAESANLQPELARKLIDLAAAFLREFRASIAARPQGKLAFLPSIPADRF